MENAENHNVSRSLIKSKKRVAAHGEVFTPSWLVEAMLDLAGDSDRVEARFLETACGNGNFLICVLRRKLAVVELKSKEFIHGKNYFALVAIMSIYGIELLEDNIVECRQRMLELFAEYLKIAPSDGFYRAAAYVLSLNIVHGDALKMLTNSGRPIVFAEWEYLGKQKFQRRDFRFELLTQASGNDRKSKVPIKVYSSMTVDEIVRSGSKICEVSL